jgi:hypothetical protein
MVRSGQPTATGGPRRRSIRRRIAANDRGEHGARHRHLGQLEDDIAAVAHDPGADLHELLARRGQWPLRHLVRQGERAQEVGQIVGERELLEPHRVVAVGAAGQACPTQRVLALLNLLLRRTAAVVELADPPGRPLQVGDEEANTGIQFALVPLDLMWTAREWP